MYFFWNSIEVASFGGICSSMFLILSTSSFDQVILYLQMIKNCFRMLIPSASCICVGLFWTTLVTTPPMRAMNGNYRKGEVCYPIFVAMWKRLNSWLYPHHHVLYKYLLADQLLQGYTKHHQQDLPFLFPLHL